jgi:hypothetical protein
MILLKGYLDHIHNSISSRRSGIDMNKMKTYKRKFQCYCFLMIAVELFLPRVSMLISKHNEVQE